jgi:hypothetical protein
VATAGLSRDDRALIVEDGSVREQQLSFDRPRS